MSELGETAHRAETTGEKRETLLAAGGMGCRGGHRWTTPRSHAQILRVWLLRHDHGQYGGSGENMHMSVMLETDGYYRVRFYANGFFSTKRTWNKHYVFYWLDGLVDCFIGVNTIDRMDKLIDQLINYFICWLVDWLMVRPIDWLTASSLQWILRYFMEISAGSNATLLKNGWGSGSRTCSVRWTDRRRNVIVAAVVGARWHEDF